MPRQDLKLLARILTLRRKDIAEYIPKTLGCNPVNSFRLLIIIQVNPKLTISDIRKLTGSDSNNIDKTVKHLLNLGLITTSTKNRWITQINAWRVNEVYIITQKGHKTVHNLVDYAQTDRVNCEINHATAI